MVDFINFSPVLGRFKHIYFRMKRLKSIISILAILSCILLFQACPYENFTVLYLDDNSIDTLAVYVADGIHTAYPDTLLPNTFKNGLLGGNSNKGKGVIYAFPEEPEKTFKRLPKDTLSVFILNMNNTDGIKVDSSWKEMNYGKRFLQRYDLSIQDIKRLKFLLSYPPDERMQGIKMYPPYGSE